MRGDCVQSFGLNLHVRTDGQIVESADSATGLRAEGGDREDEEESLCLRLIESCVKGVR